MCTEHVLSQCTRIHLTVKTYDLSLTAFVMTHFLVAVKTYDFTVKTYDLSLTAFVMTHFLVAALISCRNFHAACSNEKLSV